jgi:phosphate transport system substrate-binding protein
MKTGWGVFVLVLAVVYGVLCFMPRQVQAIEIQGAGSTFAAPLYQEWIQGFRKVRPGVTIHYAPVGSGEGVARFEAGSVDFAGSDVAIPEAGDDRRDSLGLQLPVAAGMVVIAYNLPGITGLELPRSVYSDIFLRKILRWDDPRIAAANPRLRLPPIPIEVVAREDSSGTTFAFTSHMDAISPSWEPGVGKTVSWSKDVKLAKGNEGLAERIKSHVGAIGYVEYGVAERSALSMARLENKTGRYIAPSLEACRVSIFTQKYYGLEWLKNMILDPAAPGAYPIVTFSWLILRWEYPDEKWKSIETFVNFILDEGQNMAPKLGYASLPEPIVYRGRMVVGRVAPGNPAGLSTVIGSPASTQPTADVKDAEKVLQPSPKGLSSHDTATPLETRNRHR